MSHIKQCKRYCSTTTTTIMKWKSTWTEQTAEQNNFLIFTPRIPFFFLQIKYFPLLPKTLQFTMDLCTLNFFDINFVKNKPKTKPNWTTKNYYHWTIAYLCIPISICAFNCTTNLTAYNLQVNGFSFKIKNNFNRFLVKKIIIFTISHKFWILKTAFLRKFSHSVKHQEKNYLFCELKSAKQQLISHTELNSNQY